jgi:hypothetical protein
MEVESAEGLKTYTVRILFIVFNAIKKKLGRAQQRDFFWGYMRPKIIFSS